MKFRELRLLPLLTFVSLLFVISLIFPNYLFATSGCCSGHSGVNCAAGAQANGNVICNDGWRGSSCSYSSMVMCGESTSQTVIYTAAPVATPAPVVYTPRPTTKTVVTLAPTPTTTPVLIETPTQTISPGVTSTSVTPTPTPAPVTTGGAIGALVVLAIIIGLPVWIIIKIIKKFKNHD